MPMEITFELSDADLDFFRSVMSAPFDKATDLDAESIIEKARDLINQVRESNASAFIRERVGHLEILIGMLIDPDWKMESQDRPRVLEALAYFAEPNDLIPDDIPGLGFLDDAIMIEIVCRDLKYEIEAYRDFCVYRVAESHHMDREGSDSKNAEWLEERRRQLHLRMHRKRSVG